MNNLKTGLIFFHSLVFSIPHELLNMFIYSNTFGLGLSKETIIKVPKAGKVPVGILPPTYVGSILPGSTTHVRS